MAPATTVDDQILTRARAVYLARPGLPRPGAPAQRLWGLDPRTCDELLTTLTSARFLARTRDGSFVLSATRM
jgi:hypothetical protein